MICDFLIGRGAAMLPPMTFDEVGQGPLFGSEWLHAVWIYTIAICAYVNEFCLMLKATSWTSVGPLTQRNLGLSSPTRRERQKPGAGFCGVSSAPAVVVSRRRKHCFVLKIHAQNS